MCVLGLLQTESVGSQLSAILEASQQPLLWLVFKPQH